MASSRKITPTEIDTLFKETWVTKVTEKILWSIVMRWMSDRGAKFVLEQKRLEMTLKEDQKDVRLVIGRGPLFSVAGADSYVYMTGPDGSSPLPEAKIRGYKRFLQPLSLLETQISWEKNPFSCCAMEWDFSQLQDEMTPLTWECVNEYGEDCYTNFWTPEREKHYRMGYSGADRDYFLMKIAQEVGKPVDQISEKDMEQSSFRVDARTGPMSYYEKSANQVIDIMFNDDHRWAVSGGTISQTPLRRGGFWLTYRAVSRGGPCKYGIVVYEEGNQKSSDHASGEVLQAEFSSSGLQWIYFGLSNLGPYFRTGPKAEWIKSPGYAVSEAGRRCPLIRGEDLDGLFGSW